MRIKSRRRRTYRLGDHRSVARMLSNRATTFDFTSGVLDPRITYTGGENGTYFDSSGVLQVSGVDEPRLTHEYDSASGLWVSRGLMGEAGAVNLLTTPNDFSGAGWSRTNTTLTPAAALGPDGLMSLSKVQATASATAALQKAVISAGSASGNAFSVFARKGSGATDCNQFVLRNTTTATNLVWVSINYDTGALTYTNGTGPASAIDLGGGLWRIPIMAASGINASDTLTVYVGFLGVAETAGEFAYIGFTKLEAGPNVTSYHEGTRTADVTVLDGAEFTEIWNPSEGTVVVTYRALENTISRGVFSANASSGATSNRVDLRTNGNVFVTSGGVDQASLFGTVPAAGERVKAAVSFKENGFGLTINGTSVADDTSGSLPVGVDRFLIGMFDNLSNHGNVTIERLSILPSWLSTTQREALTA